MRTLPVLALATAAVGLLGCGEDEQSLLAPPGTVSTPVSWAQARPIIESHCARCHASYLDPKEAKRAAGDFVGYLETRQMPVVGAVEPLNNTDWNTLITWARGNRQ